MKFLITGIGSIGQRHYKNLIELGHEVAVFRSSNRNTQHIETFIQDQEQKGKAVIQYFNFEEAIKLFNPDAVFITNPNSKHLETALLAAQFGKHLFIEKPLAHELGQIASLVSEVASKKLKVMVGYNLRWHPLLREMKQRLKDGEIGKPLSASIEMGENIEDWHPWENYLDTYAPYKHGGGGAVLCFSHDLDYLYWFFGLPKKMFALGGKMTPLGGDAEDLVKVLCQFENDIIVDIHLDYWQRPKRRRFEILGTEGSLHWDYDQGTLTITPHKEPERVQIIKVPDSYERNIMFVNEVKDFISAIEHDRETPIDLRQGIDVLQFAQDIKLQINF